MTSVESAHMFRLRRRRRRRRCRCNLLYGCHVATPSGIGGISQNCRTPWQPGHIVERDASVTTMTE